MMRDKDKESESGLSSYLPKKMPGGTDIFKRGASQENTVNQRQVNTKIFIAAALTASASFLVSLAHMAVPNLTIYSYLFMLVNLGGYVFIYNRTRVEGKTVPVGVLSAIAAMMSAGFTVATALAYSTKVAPLNPRNAIAYVVVFLLISLALMPEEMIDRIEGR
ncbi:MAG: hypothetical protein ABEJ36_03380 [Candidatus Nanosalina sp.]